MTNVEAEMRLYLQGQAELAALVGTRLYASTQFPPGYDVSQGAALLFSVRGGSMDYSAKVLRPSFQFRCYARTEPEARNVSQVLFDCLNAGKGGKLKAAHLEAMPTLLLDQETQWPFVLAFYETLFSN